MPPPHVFDVMEDSQDQLCYTSAIFLSSKMGLHADISGFPELSAGIYVSNVAAKKRTRRNCHGELE